MGYPICRYGRRVRRWCGAMFAVVTMVIVTAALAGNRPARADDEVWTVLMDEKFPPFAYVEDGIPQGVDTEIITAVLNRIGVTPQYQPMPWNRVVRSLEWVGYDMAFQFVDTPERRERFVLVGPFRTGRTVIMVRRDTAFRYESLEDLAGLRVITVQGFAYTKAFDEATGFTRIPVGEVGLGVRMLAAGRADAMIGDIWSLANTADVLGLSGQLLVLPGSLSEVGRHVIFPKGKEGKAARFAEGLGQIRADGTLQSIVNKWLNPSLVQIKR